MALTKIDDRGLKTPIDLLDSEYIRLGTSQDLQIGHNGTNGFITQTGSKLVIGPASNHQTELLYGNAKKFETTSWGAQVSGNFVSTGVIDLADGDGASTGASLLLGNDDDLKIYHDGSNSYLEEDGAGQLIIRGWGPRLQAGYSPTSSRNSGEDAVVCVTDGAVELYYNAVKKLETTSTGILISGGTHKQQSSGEVSISIGSTNAGGAAIYFDGDSNGDFVGADYSWIRHTNGGDMEISCDSPGQDSNLYVYHQTSGGQKTGIYSGANGAVNLYYDGTKKFETTSSGVSVSGDIAMTTNDINFGDTGKIQLGGSQDLQIYHSGSIGVINNGANSTAGHLVIRGDDIYLQGSNTHEELAHFIENGACELYYNNSKSLETNSEGIVIRGAEDNHGVIYLYADEGDDNPDMWSIQAKKTASTFTIQNNNAGAWDNSLKCHGDGAVELYYDNVKKFDTTSHGADFHSTAPAVVGIHSTDGGNTSEARLALGAYSSNPPEQRGVQVVAYNMNAGHHMDLRTSDTHSAGPTTKMRITNDGHITIPNDNKQLQIGAGNDLYLYSDGTNGLIRSPNGRVYVQSDTGVNLTKIGNVEKYVECDSNGAVKAYYDDSKKFETNSTGASLFGLLKLADGVHLKSKIGVKDIANVSTSWTTIASTGIGGISFIQVFNDSGGAQCIALVMWRATGIEVISESDNTGLSVSYQVSGGALQIKTTSGTISGSATYLVSA